MSLTHAFIVPLIGGQVLGQEAAFGSKPDYILSYTPFSGNDAHIINRFPNKPYILLDQGGVHPHYVDVVGTTCPCAGLSSLSPSANSDASVNDWMYTTATYVLEKMQPKVFWGENAPRFAGEMGRPIVANLMKIAKKNGYTMSIYRTKSLLHGLSQVRERSFYFFWKGDKVPVFNYFDRQYETIEELLRKVPKDASQNTVTNEKIPSKDDPFYRYILEEMHGGITHQEFFSKIEKTVDTMSYIENNGISYKTVKLWMEKNGYEKIASKLDAIQDKLDAGGNIMRRYSVIGKGYTGAFVGHMPMMLTHPDEDRYITYREAMSIMKLPYDFELLSPKKNLNHVCQNVPVTTATDMAMEIKATLEGRRDMISAPRIYQFNASKTQRIEDDEPAQSLESFL
jgi:site-specific DNA-cytosine methylase